MPWGEQRTRLFVPADPAKSIKNYWFLPILAAAIPAERLSEADFLQLVHWSPILIAAVRRPIETLSERQ
jgi:hypothetical protein